MIAALFVQTGGVYFGLPNVDPWDVKRDARQYAGPWPVVAHPPCSRWCRLAGLVEELSQTIVAVAERLTTLVAPPAVQPPQTETDKPSKKK